MRTTFQRQRVVVFILGILFTVSPAYCSTYYVATTGNNGNPGDIDHPFQTIGYAVGLMAAGDTVYVRAGTYSYSGSSSPAITVGAKSGASASNRPKLFAYPGERPLLDFTAKTGTSADGIKITGSYWYVKGLDCKGAPHNGIKISGGSYNIVEFCSSYENRNAGVQLSTGAAYNQFINCDSYHNYDPQNNGGDADGFSPKLDVGTGNYFYGCRSWLNSDDGWDGYMRPSDNITTTIENCWSFGNGWSWIDGSTNGSMNGNGFKTGGSDNKDLRHNQILKNCLSFNNKSKGFDQNNNKGSVTINNCTAFNNGGYNFSFPTSPAGGGTTSIINCVSYLSTGVNLGGVATQMTNSWMDPFVVTSDDFNSIDPSAAYGARNADGSLPDITFMHLVAGSDLIDGGTDAMVVPYCGSAPDLGCFEYCAGGIYPGQASIPTPSNGATSVSITQDLSWTAGSGATSHDVYFGTTSPVGTFQGNQTGTTFNTGTMDQATTYYWLIYEKNAYGTNPGIAWSFTTVFPPPPGAASNPSPSNGATGVSNTQTLSWTAGSGIVSSHDVYFGTASSPPLVSSSQTATTYDPGTMVQGINYYWRIDEKNISGTTTGTVWHFTTAPPPPPGAATNPTPANGAANVSQTQDLLWTTGSGIVDSHDVYF
jgi:hypothetical protein